MNDISRIGDEKTPAEISGVYLGRYRLCFELATGGMATVYLASVEGPVGFEKIAAVKRIHPHMAKTGTFVEMFLDEARIASQISHANVCTVFDFGEAEGSYFIAMEYLLGETLARVMKRVHTLADPKLLAALPGIATRVVADLCEGLHAAHELTDANGRPLGVVHRDVSPQNMFITYDGVSKVVDFGVAIARERLHHTIGSQLKGKYAYLSPEQVGGVGIDRRADVWGLGVVLWEFLTLRRLFKRSTEAATLMGVLRGQITPPSKVRAGVPPELDQVVAKALDRDVNSRYPTARELGRELLRVQTQVCDPVGLAEVAEWMGALFDEDRARKLSLVERTRLRAGTPEQVLSASHDAIVALSRAAPPAAPSLWTRLMGSPARALLTVVTVAVVAASMTFGATLAIYGSDSVDDDQAVTERNALIASGPIGEGSKLSIEPPIPVDREPIVEAQADAGPVASKASTNDGGAPNEATTPSTDDSGDDGPGPRTKVRYIPSGFVSISTPGGWAYVYKGGRRLGQTPLRAKLPIGRHVLKLRPYGNGPWRTVSVVIERNKVARVVSRLEPRQ